MKISLPPSDAAALGGARITLSLMTVGAIALASWQFGQKVEADKVAALQQMLRLQETIVLRDELGRVREELKAANAKLDVLGTQVTDVQTKVTTINQDVQELKSAEAGDRRFGRR